MKTITCLVMLAGICGCQSTLPPVVISDPAPRPTIVSLNERWVEWSEARRANETKEQRLDRLAEDPAESFARIEREQQALETADEQKERLDREQEQQEIAHRRLLKEIKAQKERDQWEAEHPGVSWYQR